jgi:hypothetical protein
MMFDQLQQTFYIIEYAPRDSMGRTRDWCFGGLAKNDVEITAVRDKIESQHARVEIHVHPYAHLGA